MSKSGPITTTCGWDHPNGRHLTPQEHDTIRKLIQAGYSHREIGIRMNRGRTTISRAARGMSIKPAQAKRPWTAEDDSQLIRLLNQGLSHSQIAEALHRTPQAIAYRICFLRKRQNADAEIRYQVLQDPPPPVAVASPIQAEPQASAAMSEKRASGLPQEQDLWSIWNRAVFGAGQRL